MAARGETRAVNTIPGDGKTPGQHWRSACMSLDMEQLPQLPYEDWRPTLQTLHRWTQIVGKIKLAKSPWLNHSWSSALYVTPRGLTTGVMHDGDKSYSVEFDFIDHVLRVEDSFGRTFVEPLIQESVAAFHRRCFGVLENAGCEIKINEIPNELPDATPLTQDESHATYDPIAVSRFQRTILFADRVMKKFRARFIGKVSPVHFFWGSFDMAVTRFSGKRAPEHPGGFPNLPDIVTRDAYSHEVSSCGFWPGNDLIPYAAFYSYAYPMPWGFDAANLTSPGAVFEPRMKEFLLPYEDVRKSDDPESMVLKFFQETYEAAADLGNWNRRELEYSPYLQVLQQQHDHFPPLAG